MSASSPRPRSTRRGRSAVALLVAASTIASLGAAELSFRAYLYWRYRGHVAEFMSPIWVLLENSPLVFRLPPNQVGRAGFTFDATKNVPYRTNSDGFRDREPGEKRPGVPRVVVLGDSYVFGWAVLEAETFPTRAEALLRREGRAVEILNAGVPGYNTEQESYLLEEILPRRRPDAVVVGYTMNDAEPQMNVPSSPATTYRYVRSWLWEGTKDLLRTCCFPHARWLPDRRNIPRLTYTEGFEAESPKWRESKAALARMAAFCRRRGVALGVMILPDFTQPLDGAYPDASIHAAVSAWGRELGIETVDLLPLFRNRDHRDYMVAGDGHPNARAHDELARVLRDEIVSLLGDRRGEGAAEP